MEKQPVLSISLLASNRKATIRKCLDSLKEIMEKIPSELIIVDTGCDEETRGILEEYTDQIISFQWCDDFARARNAGLKLAKGEWFLFIDDDEWFTDVSEIVNFFVSGEYKKYWLACYIQRNFSEKSGKAYTDSWVSRMIRLTKDTRFVGIIHEYLAPVLGECKFLKSPAHHYGYIYDSEEEKYKHARRNITLLQEIIQKEKNNSRWWIQLAQEYRGIGESYMLYDLCKDGIRHFTDYDSEQINKDRGCFYVGCLYADRQRSFFQEAIRDYEEAIQDERNTEACQAALHLNVAASYLQNGQYEKVAQCCRSYLRTYRKLRKDERMLADQSSFFVRDAFEKAGRNDAYSYLIISELKLGNSQALQKYFKDFGWDDEVLSLSSDLIPEMIEFWSKAEYEDCYARMADTLMKRKGVSDVVVCRLQEKEKELEEADFMRLARIFSQVDSTHYYIFYLRVLYGDFCRKIEKLSGDFEKMVVSLADFFGLPDKVWKIAQRGNVDLGSLFLRMPFDRFKMAVDSFAGNSDRETLEKRREMMTGLKIQDDIRYGYFMLKTMENLTVDTGNCDSYEILYEMLQDFVDGELNFYGHFFNDNAFDGEMEILPPSCRLAVRLGEALLEEREGNCKAVLEKYRDCLGIYPSMNDTIRKYAHFYKEKAEKYGDFNREMENLSRGMKKRLRFLIEQGLDKEAEELVRQLKGFFPEDKELEALGHGLET